MGSDSNWWMRLERKLLRSLELWSYGESLFDYEFIPSHIQSCTLMGFPTKIQLIKRANNEQWYINFPSAIAQAMEFEKGEIVEWVIEDKNHLTLQRIPQIPEDEKSRTKP